MKLLCSSCEDEIFFQFVHGLFDRISEVVVIAVDQVLFEIRHCSALDGDSVVLLGGAEEQVHLGPVLIFNVCSEEGIKSLFSHQTSRRSHLFLKRKRHLCTLSPKRLKNSLGQHKDFIDHLRLNLPFSIHNILEERLDLLDLS